MNMAPDNIPLFSTGDMVFAKLKNYTFWLASIESMTPAQNSKSLKYTIKFFGDYTTAVVKQTVLVPYSDNKSIHRVPKIENSRNKKCNEALTEAETAFQNLIKLQSPPTQSANHS